MINLVPKRICTFEVVPRLIYIQSNRRILPGFSISPFLNDAPLVSEILPSNFTFSLIIKQLKVRNDKISDSFGDFMLYQDNNVIYCNKLAPFITLKLLFKPFENKIVADPLYFRLIREKVGSAYPADVILMDWVYIKLLLNDHLVLHASGVSYNECSYLFIAPPNTGKTTTALQFLVNDNLCKYLGEDSVIVNVNKNKVYSTPHTSTFFHHKGTIWRRISNLVSPKYKPTARRLFKSRIQEEPCEIKTIFVLKKSPTIKIIKMSDANVDEIIGCVLRIQRYEFSWFKNPLIIATDFLLELDLDKLLKKEEDIIKRFLRDNVHKTYLITAPSGFDFYKLIKKSYSGGIAK